MDYVDIFKELGFEPEEPKKKENKKTKGKSTKDDVVKLPVTVYTGYTEPVILKPDDFKGKNEVSIKEAHEYLGNLLRGYPKGLTVCQKGKGNVLYLVHKSDYAIGKDEIHINKDTVFMIGNLNIDINVLKTSEACNINCKDLNKLFSDMFPKYGNIRFLHSAVSNVIVPTFNYPKLLEKLDFPVTIGVFGREEISVTKEDYNKKLQNAEEKADPEKLKKLVVQKYPDFGEEHLVLQWNNKHKIVIAKMVEKKDSSNNKEENMIPTNATVSLIYTKFEITPEMFDGKLEIEKEELRQYIAKDRPEYAKERTNITYDEEQNLIIVVCIGSRKGIDVLNSYEGFDRLFSDKDELFDWYLGYSLYRVEKTEVSITMASKVEGENGSYKFLLPKVPLKLFGIMVDFFREIYRLYKTEVMLQLFYDKKVRKYFWYLPDQEVSSHYCNIKRNIEIEMAYTLVADFHSHGSYNAYFSNTDNADELGNRVYGVIGNIDTDEITYQLRAGTGGYYVYIHPSKIFEMEENDNLDGSDSNPLQRLLDDAKERVTFISC